MAIRPCTHAREEDHESRGQTRPHRICGLKPGQRLRQQGIVSGAPADAVSRPAPHGRDCECEEGDEGRDQRLSGDIYLHAAISAFRQNTKKRYGTK